MFADNNGITGIFVFKTEFNPLVTVSATSNICLHLNNTEKMKTQLNFLKMNVLWNQQQREFSVVFIKHDYMQIP